MNIWKQGIQQRVDNVKHLLFELGDFIHSHPEVGNEEFKAVERITGLLKNLGFAIESNVAGLPTAFIATRETRVTAEDDRNNIRIDAEETLTVGLICEYDALTQLGHACGHHLQPAAIVGAATALCDTLSDVPLRIVIYGTPAEETTSGKLPMSKLGLFERVDFALMMHAGDRTTVDGDSLALNNIEFTFEGKASHAAVAPELGISALDAVLMTFNGIEYLREHVRSDVRMHGIILQGGTALNVVPDKAVAQFSIRAKDRAYLNSVVERVENVARSGALATGAKLHIHHLKELDGKVSTQTLNQLLLDNAREMGAKQITPRERTGSTDFSCITNHIPGACLRVAFVPIGVSNHTQEWVDAGTTSAAHDAILVAAKALAGTVCDVIENPELLQQIKHEYALVKPAAPSHGAL